jgi:glucose-6-phosphate isomerase
MSLSTINPTHTAAWAALSKSALRGASQTIKQHFNSDIGRFDKYSIRFEDILFDFSKNNFDSQTLSELLALAQECRVKGRY